MKKIILTFLTFVTISFMVTAQGVIQWAKDIGTTNNEYPSKICSDNNGNSYMGGSYSLNLIICNDTLATVQQPTTSNQTQNLFISKFDSLGNCIWTKAGISIVPMISGGAIAAEIKDIEYYGGSIYCLGVFTDSMIFDNDTLFNPTCVGYCTSSFLLCLDAASGTINWSKCFEGTTTYSRANTVIPYRNGIFVSGIYSNYLAVDTVRLDPPNPWNRNGYLLKFNNSGICIWGQNIGVTSSCEVLDMAYDNAKNLYLVGSYSDTIIFPTDTLFDILPISIPKTFFAKYDTSGNFIWVKGGMANIRGRISGSGLDYGNNNYLYFNGIFSDSVRFGTFSFTNPTGIYSDVIVKIDQTGQFLWAKKTGNRPSLQSFASSFATNNAGFMLFSGFTNTVVLGVDTVQSNGGLDNLLTQYDFDGNIIYHKNFGGASYEIPKDVYCIGNLTYFVGRTMSNYLIDNFNITNVFGGDILIARMKDTTTIASIFEYAIKEDASFLIYPNPSNSSTTVASSSKIKEITIRNCWGETIFTDKPDCNSVKFELTVPGLYFLTISDSNYTLTKKLTIIR